MSRDGKISDVRNVPVDKGSLYKGPVDGEVNIGELAGMAVPSDKVIARPAPAPGVAPCPKFDAENGRCNYLGISAEASRNANKETICIRQAPRWLGNALPCKIPVILAQPAKSEFHQNERIRDVAVQVLNAVAIEDRCPHMKDGEVGPRCKPLNQPCVRPEGHDSCKVFKALAPIFGVIRGPKELESVQSAYVAELAGDPSKAPK